MSTNDGRRIDSRRPCSLTTTGPSGPPAAAVIGRTSGPPEPPVTPHPREPQDGLRELARLLLGARGRIDRPEQRCWSSVNTTGGTRPVRPSSSRSSRVKAVPRLRIGSRRRSTPDMSSLVKWFGHLQTTLSGRERHARVNPHESTAPRYARIAAEPGKTEIVGRLRSHVAVEAAGHVHAVPTVELERLPYRGGSSTEPATRRPTR